MRVRSLALARRDRPRASGVPRQARIVLDALMRCGMIVAEDGSDRYVAGAPSPQFNDDALHAPHRVRGAEFEVVQSR